MADGQQASAALTADTTDASASGHDPSQAHENSTAAIADPREQHSAENRVPSCPLVNEVNIYIHENDSEHREEVEERNASFVQETALVLNANDIKATENCIETTPSDSNLSPSEGSECQKSCEVGECSRKVVSLNERLLTLLECPVCFNYMIPPIILCESGHNICNYCRPFLSACPICRKNFLKTRNVTLENMARELNISCRFPGCTGESSEEHLNNHLSICIPQPLYACPFTLYFSCYWQGRLVDIKDHMETQHAGRILYDIQTHGWPLTLAVRDLKIIFALGEIFLYKLKLDTLNSRFYVQVFYIGPENNHRNFTYMISLSSNLCNKRVSFHNTVMSMDSLEAPSSYMFGNCVVFEYALVSEMSMKGDIKSLLNLSRKETV